MVQPSDMDGLRAAWRALAGGQQGEGWKTIPVAIVAPCTLLAGRRLPGDAEALLVGFRYFQKVPDSRLPQGHGFEVSSLSSDPTGGDRSWLALARKPGASLELFTMMAEDLLRLLQGSKMQDEGGVLNQFLSRIHAWQDFMDRHRDGLLSPEAELGLFGELVLVDLMIEAGVQPRNVLDAWQGPLDGLQDFVSGGGGIEVKTTLSTSGFPAIVNSLEQLDDSLRQPIFVAAVRLRLDSLGTSLPQMAEKIRHRLRDQQIVLGLFEIRLMQAGLLNTVSERYARTFALVATALLPVRDSFPRLTRRDVHFAVRKARYEIDLDQAGVPDIGLPQALELLGGDLNAA
jgi:hypothetical protein